MSNLSPITLEQKATTLLADTHTPVSAFMALPSQESAILLESAAVGGTWGRYSLIATEAALFIHCQDGRLHLEIHDEILEPLKALEGQPYCEGLRNLMKLIDLKSDPSLSLPPITRALYGYFGYGMAGIFQAHLAKVLPPNEAESCLMLARTVVLFDHLYNKIYQASWSQTPLSIFMPPSPQKEELNFGAPTQDPSAEEYADQVEKVRELLRQGEGIQVVLSQHNSMSFEGDPFLLYRRLRQNNPSPYMFYQRFPEITLFGASPEVMVRTTDGHLELSPIAGTRPRGKDEAEDAQLAIDLLQDPKEKAEHTMLVDLGRNDLGRIARPSSVVVEESMKIQRFSHVMHMTSHISASLRQGLDALDVLAATFPAGTVSGAPKVRAMEIIAEYERRPRGPYAGALAWLGLDPEQVHLDTGIIIRSLWMREGQLHWQTGAGIVFDSDPMNEAAECQHKGAILAQILER